MPAKSYVPGTGFPARLDRILAEKNLTYREASDITGISPTTLSNWRTRRNYPEQRNFIRFCSRLRINPLPLLRAEGEPPLRLQSSIEKRFRPIIRLVEQLKDESNNMNQDDREILANLLHPILKELGECLQQPTSSSTTDPERSSSDSNSPLMPP